MKTNPKIYHSKAILRSGVTLVELLVVMAVGMLVSGVAFSIFRLSSQQYLTSEANLERSRELRAALSTLTRDLRMAGNGLFVLGPGLTLVQAYAPINSSRVCGQTPVQTNSLGWYSNCDTLTPGVRGLFGEDGGANASDVVTIFRAEPEYSEPLGEAREFEDWELTLLAATTSDSVKEGDILGLAYGSRATLLEVGALPSSSSYTVIPIKENGRFTGPNGPPTGFPVNGATVFNLRDVTIATYFVNQDTNQLVVVYHDQKANETDPKSSPMIPLADNIEDLQLFYFFKNEDVDLTKVNLDPGINTSKLENDKISAVSVGVTAKTSVEQFFPSMARPALFNRVAGADKEKARRLSIMETVQLRNAL
ncbi:MAG: prepilin-type N-terminal cleavage/methylation domain-containing protein [Deltaproteobacteria bacterium]|jgi:hypothetical protein|nr:prepilin-type N-terminal cleavage/methylation domain-containing protein [Deltaproteobacteria bacterium]